MQSLVSMIMPCYNKVEGIESMLSSICEQTWDNIELILVNDGSTDGTRDIVEEWLPIFQKRGYSTVVLDQENQGVSIAVLNGMKCMTGEYFCTVDADDWLYPSYLSTMATWLDENLEFDYAACNYEVIRGTDENWIVRNRYAELPDGMCADNRLVNVLLGRTTPVPWNLLVRKSYLLRCNVEKSFVKARISQEPSIIIPLAAGEGRIKIFQQVLYRHFQLNNKDGWKASSYYRTNRSTAYRQVVERMCFSDDQIKEKMLSLCEYYEIKLNLGGIISGQNMDLELGYDERANIAQRAADYANNHFEPSPNISAEDITRSGHKPFIFALDDCILEKRRPDVKLKFENARRVIIYGALGETAENLIPTMLRTRFKPNVYWDVAANSDSMICGAAIEKPDFSSLSENDTVVIVPLNSSVTDQVIPQLVEAGVKNVLTHFELIQYMAEIFYPSLNVDNCRFRFN